MFLRAHIAQSVEHFIGNEEVTGSNPVMSLNDELCESRNLKFIFIVRFFGDYFYLTY